MVDFSQPNPSPFIDPNLLFPNRIEGLGGFGKRVGNSVPAQVPIDPKPKVPSKLPNPNYVLPGPIAPSYNTPPGMPPSPGIDKYLFNQGLMKYLGPQGGPIQ